MSINAGLRSFLFSEVLATDLAGQLLKMITNHPSRPAATIALQFKTGEGENDHVIKEVVGFFSEECDICKKVEEKLLKITTLDGFKTITAEVKKIGDSRYLALINY